MSDGNTAILAVTLMLMLLGLGALLMLQAANKRDERELEMMRRMLLQLQARQEADDGE